MCRAKLHTVQRPWQPNVIAQLNQHNVVINLEQDVIKKLRAIINKITPENYAPLSAQLEQLNLNSEGNLVQAIDIIFDTIYRDTKYLHLIATLIKNTLGKLFVYRTNSDNQTEQVLFEASLLQRCHQEFNSDVYSGLNVDVKQQVIDECDDEQRKKLLIAEFEEEKNFARQKRIGLIK